MIEYSKKTISNWTRLGTRKAFGTMMADIVEAKDNTVVLAADVASAAGLAPFIEKYPDKFYNVGIAEQNMIAIASGLAKEGCNVFVVSFAPFVSSRVQEAVKNLVGYMKLNVKIIALSSGVSLGVQGNTHFCLDDLALMRTIPGMKILSPADCCEMAKCLEYLNQYQGMAYLRLTGIDGNPGIYKDDFEFVINQWTELREGDDVAILATGAVTSECVRAARALKKDNVSCAVYNICSIKPMNEGELLRICEKHKMIVTVEEHSEIGGLGSAVGEVMHEKKLSSKLLRIGVRDEFLLSGDYNYMKEQVGLTAAQILQRIVEECKEEA